MASPPLPKLFLLFTAMAMAALAQHSSVHLHFYLHDIPSGPNATAVVAASGPKPAPSAGPPSLFNFGDVVVIDDPLTEGPNLSASKLVGRAQGFYVLASQGPADPALLLTTSLVFTEGRHAGSTLVILSRDAVLAPVRELPVVGGSGAFRWARGYVLVKTYALNSTNGNAILEWDVYVHY
ncbi:dirigent protein 21-like [Curcuma longa]|uniref:dirigent protein 21-like n=1 Tax=Curcuma longa TaxID=136217 RepID=UPI003D9F00B4